MPADDQIALPADNEPPTSGQSGLVELDRAAEFAAVEMEAAADTWRTALNRAVAFIRPRPQHILAQDLGKVFSGRHVCATVQLAGSRSGESFLIFSERDALAMVGLFAMLPADQVEAKLRERFSWEDFDAFGEIVNQMTGAARVVLSERFKDRFELTPGPVTVIDPGEPRSLINLFGDRSLLAVSFQFSIAGFETSPMVRLYGHDLTQSYRISATESIPSSGHPPEQVVASFADLADALGREVMGALDAQTFTASPAPAQEISQDDPFAAAAAEAPAAAVLHPELKRILHICLPVQVAIARKPMTVGEMLDLTVGSVIEFDKAVDAPLALVVGGRSIAEGRAVVKEARFALELSRIIPPKERIQGSS